MAVIGVRKRNGKTSTVHHKQALSDKNAKYERRPSLTLRNTRSTIENKSATTEKVTNSSKKMSNDKKSLLLRSNKKNVYFNENSISVEKSKSSRKSSISCQIQDRNSFSRITRKSSLENISKMTLDQSKTPISSKSVSQNNVRKSVKGFKNLPLKNITNNYENKQISRMSTRKFTEHDTIQNTAQQASIRCTRSSTGKSSSASLKKFCTDSSKNTLDASEVQVSTKPTKKSFDFTPEIAFKKTRLSVKQRKISGISSVCKASSASLKKPCTDTSKNTLDASEVQISTEPTQKSLDLTPKIAFEKTQLFVKAKKISVNSKKKSEQDIIKDGSSTRPANQTPADINYNSTSQRFSTRLAQKMSNNQEHTSSKDAQLSLVTAAKKRTSSISNKTKNSSSKNSLSSFGKTSLLPLCETQRSFLKGGRSSMSPLRKIGSIQKQVSTRCTKSSSATTACKRNFTDKKSQNKSECVKKSSGSHKYTKEAKSFDLSSIPLDDLMPKASGTKRKLKSADFKLPGKKTLKYKRMTVEAVKQADIGYEDDIFESKNFDIFQELLCSPTVSESVLLMSTPKLGIDLTPVVHKKTPVFKDCFNPEELAKRRKVAEEYFHRINKNRKSSQKLATPIPVIPEKKKLEFSDVLKKASEIQEEINKQSSEDDEEDKEDSYFSFSGSPTT